MARELKNPDFSAGAALGTHSGAGVEAAFLEHLRFQQTPVTIFLVNGVKLQGVIPAFDEQAIILRRDGHAQLVYKHAVSTIMPVESIALFSSGGFPTSGFGDKTRPE